ncbi:MAG TPA: hypothetical protein VIX84_02140 [Acidimicrobiales bacterium]
MSMYSELLCGLCAEVDPVPLPASRDELVVILLQCRRRLQGHGVEDGHVMAEDLALELDHDRMLLRLCSAVGIETDPSRFDNPLAERERLEDRLRRNGIDFRTLDDHRRAPAVA